MAAAGSRRMSAAGSRRMSAAGIRSRAPSQRRSRRPQVIAIPPITAAAMEHRLQRLIRRIRLWRTSCGCGGGCAELPAAMEQSRYGLRISAHQGLLDSALPTSFARSQTLVVKRLDQLLERERQLAEPWHHRGLAAISCRRAAGQSGACCSNQEVSPPKKTATWSCANVIHST